MYFELWTYPSGNLIDDFSTEDEALTCVREMLGDMEPASTESLLLTVVRADGSGETIAVGAMLAERARAARCGPSTVPTT